MPKELRNSVHNLIIRLSEFNLKLDTLLDENEDKRIKTLYKYKLVSMLTRFIRELKHM